ncbi:MAG: hypothetical protein RJB66_2654 [Pseudomonadota bacterium]|jgi:tRNA dimethylallyltransferase
MKVTFVVGATASGKSEWAIKRAEACGGVIVNCDSVQIYTHVQIGAAKPTASDRHRCAHYLFDFVQPPNEYTAGDYQRDFFALMPQLEKQGADQVFVVGGTGFYFQALEKGMYSVDKAPEELAQELREKAGTSDGLSELYQELQSFDPASSEKIHANDQYRIVRALEIIRTTGRKPSDLKKEKAAQVSSFPYALEKVGIHWERGELHQRIHRRVKTMLEEGLIEEVKELNKLGLSTWAPMSSVGYKEVQSFLKGEIKTMASLEESILISTRQLAKRQITWFRRDPQIQWITVS